MLGFCGKSETNGMKASEGFYLLFRLVGEWDPAWAIKGVCLKRAVNLGKNVTLTNGNNLF